MKTLIFMTYSKEALFGVKSSGYWWIVAFLLILILISLLDSYFVYAYRKKRSLKHNITVYEQGMLEGKEKVWKMWRDFARIFGAAVVFILVATIVVSQNLSVLDIYLVVSYLLSLLPGRHKEKKLKKIFGRLI